MHVLVLFAHPRRDAFTGELADAFCQGLREAGHSVEFADLYAEGFDPLLEAGQFALETGLDPQAPRPADVEAQQVRLDRAEGLVFIYPFWWSDVPAILKGWFDRVMAYGFAYADGQRYDTGYFRGRRGILGITTGGTLERFSEGGAFGDMSLVLHGVQHCMLEYLGLDTGVPFVAYATPRVAPAQRQEYLVQWRGRIASLCNDPEWIEQVRQRRTTRQQTRGVDSAPGWASNN